MSRVPSRVLFVDSAASRVASRSSALSRRNGAAWYRTAAMCTTMILICLRAFLFVNADTQPNHLAPLISLHLRLRHPSSNPARSSFAVKLAHSQSDECELSRQVFHLYPSAQVSAKCYIPWLAPRLASRRSRAAWG
jgi:hypothetical protein